MRALRRPEVEQKTGLKRSAIYKKMRAGEFPLPIGLGSGSRRAVAWIEAEIDAWLEAAKQRRDGINGEARDTQ
jgi:prophage regulatory protein